MVIAIDGPAGAGKSSVARALAQRLGFTYMDSGAMYRCVALAALERGLPLDGPALGEHAPTLEIALGKRITINGRDVTDAIRTPAVSEAASHVATMPAVRAAMVARQRELLEHGDWVAEGRDIGTVVAPGAELKVYLTAQPQERARRRAAELGLDPVRVLAEQLARDARDRTRAHSPLRPADDAIVLDTTGRSVEHVVEQIVALAGLAPSAPNAPNAPNA